MRDVGRIPMQTTDYSVLTYIADTADCLWAVLFSPPDVNKIQKSREHLVPHPISVTDVFGFRDALIRF